MNKIGKYINRKSEHSTHAYGDRDKGRISSRQMSKHGNLRSLQPAIHDPKKLIIQGARATKRPITMPKFNLPEE